MEDRYIEALSHAHFKKAAGLYRQGVSTEKANCGGLCPADSGVTGRVWSALGEGILEASESARGCQKMIPGVRAVLAQLANAGLFLTDIRTPEGMTPKPYHCSGFLQGLAYAHKKLPGVLPEFEAVGLRDALPSLIKGAEEEAVERGKTHWEYGYIGRVLLEYQRQVAADDVCCSLATRSVSRRPRM